MKSNASADLELLMTKKTDDLKTHQWVYQLLRNNLLCGRIEPGKSLTIRGLAEILDVSPMPVREALHRLTCEGAVEVKNNRRVIVPMMTAEKFTELCDLRILLETHAAEGALPYIKESDIEALEQQAGESIPGRSTRRSPGGAQEPQSVWPAASDRGRYTRRHCVDQYSRWHSRLFQGSRLTKRFPPCLVITLNRGGRELRVRSNPVLRQICDHKDCD